MNSIRPLYLELKNIGSFGNKPTRIEFPGPGESLLIKGDIGAGKSTILSSLFYCLTGKKMNGNAATLVNSVNGKDAVVESAWFIPGRKEPLVIRRGMKPSLLSVSGVKASTQAEIQAELDRIVHVTDPHVLLNLCVLSVSRSLPFFGLDKQARLQFLRTFVDTNELDNLSEAAKNEHLNAKRSASNLLAELTGVERQRSRLATELDRCSVSSASADVFTKHKREELEKLLDLGKNLLTQAEYDKKQYLGQLQYDIPPGLDMRKFYPDFAVVSKLRGCIDAIGLEAASGEMAAMEGDLRSMRAKLAAMEQGIEDTKLNITRVTSETCKAHLNEMLLAQEQSRDGVVEAIRSLGQEVSSAESRLRTKAEHRRALESEIASIINAIEKSIADFRRRNAEIEDGLRKDDAAKLRSVSADIEKKKRDSLTHLLAEADNEIGQLKFHMAVHERMAKVAEEYRAVLDNTWSYMTSRMIPYINSRLPYYMNRLGLDFTMVLDSADISKPIFKGRPGIGELKLDDLSTGQIRAISFCLAHALRDLESNIHGVEIGFLAVDELASNFNPDMVAAMMDFEFKNMKETQTALILITHDIALHNRPEWTHIIEIERTLFSSVRVIK